MSKKRFVVTGAKGFVGGHLTRALTSEGSVFQVDLPTHDILNRNDLTKAFSQFAPIDCVFHLAAQKSISVSRSEPAQTLELSLSGTLNVLEAARVSSAKRVVLISSVAVYKDSKQMTEISPTSGQTIYSQSKLGAEQLGLTYQSEFGVRVTICRLSNVYGPGQSEDAVIPSLVRQMVQNNQVTLGNTKSRRDFINIDDVVSALMFLAQKEEAAGEIFNVGSGESYSVEEIFNFASTAFGFSKDYLVDYERAKAPTTEIAPVVEKIKNLGWLPKVGIKEGLAQLIQWEVQRRNR